MKVIRKEVPWSWKGTLKPHCHHKAIISIPGPGPGIETRSF